MKRLRVFDVETTSKEPDGEVVEVGYCDLDRDTGKIGDIADSYLCGVKAIPPDVRAVHHIWPEDVAGLPPFDPDAVLQLALDTQVLGFVAHKADFEAQWIGRTLEGVMPLLCTYRAALRVWPDAPTHSNFGLLYWLKDQGLVAPVRERMTPSHRALPDAYATAHVLKALFDAGMEGKDLSRWSREPPLLPRCPIGKFRNKPWAEVEYGFLRWMTEQREMEADLKWLAQQEMDRRNTQ